MRNTVVSVVVIGILLMGCKSIPRSDSSALMADVKTLEQEAMASIAQFREQLDGNPEAPQPAQDLLPKLNGFWNLSPDIIPETWI